MNKLTSLLFILVLPVLIFSGHSIYAHQDVSVVGQESPHSDLQDLIRVYVTKGENGPAEELLEQIITHPSASLQSIKDAIQQSSTYLPRPVGKQPHRSLQIRGRPAQYALFVPIDYDPQKSYPLIICLHGAGFRGDAYLERWVPRLENRYILACPTISMGAWWTRFGEELVMALLHTLRQQYHIDPNRVFLTGMSNGGIGTWIIGMHHAHQFAGIAPMASGIDDVLFPFVENLRSTPVYIIHGKEDRIMPVRLSRALVQEMERVGVKYRYQEHSWTHPHAGGHFFPRQELPELVKWFDGQRRASLPHQISLIRDATHLGPFGWVRVDSTDRIAAFTENLIDGHDEFIKGRIYATLHAKVVGENRIVVKTERVRRYTLFLNADLVDFSQPVVVQTNGEPSFQGRLSPDPKLLLQEARSRGDIHELYSAKLVVDISAN